MASFFTFFHLRKSPEENLKMLSFIWSSFSMLLKCLLVFSGSSALKKAWKLGLSSRFDKRDFLLEVESMVLGVAHGGENNKI